MSIKIDGNAYIEAGDLFYSDALTISIKIKPLIVAPLYKNIIIKSNARGGLKAAVNEWTLCYNNQFIAISSDQNAIDLKCPFALPIDKWTHLIAVIPANGQGRPLLSVNGKMLSNGIRNKPLLNSNSVIHLGAMGQNDPQRFFIGEFCELAIWDKAISIAHAKYLSTAIPNAPLNVDFNNLQLYIPMDEGINGTTANGQTLTNLSKYKRNFTVRGTENKNCMWITNHNPKADTSAPVYDIPPPTAEDIVDMLINAFGAIS